MSTIRVRRGHALGADRARQALASFASEMAKFGMKAEWRGNTATLKGTGASGDIAVTDDSVVITVKLGLLAKAAGIDATRLERSIEKRIDAALAG